MANGSEKYTRRELGRKAAVAGGTLAVSSPSAAAAAGDLERRPLGKTGLTVSLLGIGTSPLGAPEATQPEVDRVIAMAADEGVNYLDAAPTYRMAERRLGPAGQIHPCVKSRGDLQAGRDLAAQGKPAQDRRPTTST